MEQSISLRNHLRLISAMNALLGTLSTPAEEKDVLSRSIEDAARGLGADKYLLLLVPDVHSPRTRALLSRGFAEANVRVCERGETADGIHAGLIRAAVVNGTVQVDHTPTAAARATPPAAPRAIVCAPILDPGTETPIALLYLHQDGPPVTLSAEGDLAWITGYAGAVARLFGYYFQKLRARQEVAGLVHGEPPEHAPDLIGGSAQTQSLRRGLHETYIPAAAVPDPDPVLIFGEKGTGKDLIARYLHAYSARRRRPFIAVNCAEITDELAAARFFGHKKGSFTGAVADEVGFFRAAHTGVLFLDEIAELSPKAQGTLLRVLENRTIVPLGETREIRVDVQVVLATNRDLDEAMAEGVIKIDLVDRFRTQAIRIDPIRDRPADIPLLVRHFVAHHAMRTRKPTLGVDDEAMRLMVGYPWPGNVREIARVCSLFLTHLRPGARIDRALLDRCYPQIFRHTHNPKSSPLLFDELPLREALRAMQRELILSRLERHNWNVRSTRESLGLPKTTFHRYALDLGIAVQDHKTGARSGYIATPDVENRGVVCASAPPAVAC
jgi:DNA-binding NtrC family response regulator